MIRLIALLFILAEGEPPRLDTPTIVVISGMIGLLSIVALLLTVVIQWRKVFGRQPSVDVELEAKASTKDVDHMKLSLTGFATKSDLESVQKEHHLRARGLEEQISGLRHDLKNESDARVVSSRDTIEQFGELHAQLRETEKLIARLDERSQGVAGTVNNFDRKLDRLMTERA